ncbi:Imm50 family immunity protein [Streptomyces sp. NPDC087525]|uniref:Imm50 family immunity protein n=1 Tax=Streptomyces sp. NPDC087525 TaxID=3365793 RepID=UPI0037FA4F9C
MSTSDWPSFLDNPQDIRNLYDQEPDLNSCDLFSFLMDERGTSITLGFETSYMPQHRHHEEEPPRANSFEFYLTFRDVRQVNIKGWNGPAGKDITFAHDLNGAILAKIESRETSVAFRATSLSLTTSRVSLTSRND